MAPVKLSNLAQDCVASSLGGLGQRAKKRWESWLNDTGQPGWRGCLQDRYLNVATEVLVKPTVALKDRVSIFTATVKWGS